MRNLSGFIKQVKIREVGSEVNNMRKYLNGEEQIDYIIIGIAVGFGLGVAFSFLWIIA